MNKLVEEIIKPILENNPQIKKIVGVYGGRFQPFGPHHYKTYKWLTKQVDEAYISTSNIKKPPRHPMNFKEKVRHMSKMGVPSSKIIEEKTPYVAKNLQKKFNKDTTAFVYVFGAKDAGRLGGSGKYYKDFKKNKKNLVGYEEHGYYLVAPHVSISVSGKEVSGTTMRELLGSDKYDDKERAKLFKKMFGYFNQGVFNMMVNKFKKLFEINEGLPTKVKDKHKKLKINPQSDAERDFYIHHAGDKIGTASEPDTYDWDDDFKEKGGVQDTEKDKKKKGYEPVEESEMEFKPKSMYYVPSKKKPLKKKWKDGKGIELLKDKDLTPLEKKQIILLGRAMRELPGSPKQKAIKKQINVIRKKLGQKPIKEVNLPIKVGDTILMGRFKNKKVVIKDIGFNDKGDLLINGRPALKFRIVKSKEIDEFLIHNDITKIIREISHTGNVLDANDESDLAGLQAVDSGPSAFMGGMDGYAGRNKVSAEKIGWDVMNYILDVDVDSVPPTDSDMLSLGWPFGPHSSVSYLPAGIGTGKTPNNQENLSGRAGYNKWLRNIRAVAQEVGMELMKFRQKDKDVVKQMAKDATDTLKNQKEEEKQKEKEVKSVKVEENVFSKDWWSDNLTEVSAKTKLFKQKLMRRGISIRYDKAKAEKDLVQKYGGQGEVVGKKFGLRKAYYAVPKKGFKQDKRPILKINKKEMEKLHHDKKLDKGNLKVVYTEGLITEGGAYGHMSHPFDDKDLTFGDLKKIIELGLGGQLNREDNVTEKLDGQNIMISWKDGKLIAARNKGHIKNGGKTALDTKGIASKFKGRGDIADAFNFAMKDLERAIKGLSQKQKDKIFNNGYNFMNMEVMWPKSANVIDYDKAELVFHGALVYDDKGNVKGEVKGSGRILAGMIKQINQHIQKKYAIGKPVFLQVPKHQDFGKMKSKFLGRLSKLQSKFGLSDNDTLGLYHQKWWEQFILKQLKKISPKVLEGLVKRWAFFDKSYKIPQIKQDLKDEPIFLEWVLKTDKENHAKIVKENMRPFEILFFEVGAEILKNVQGFIAANPTKAVQNMKKNLNKAISDVRKGGDLKKLNRLKVQLDRLNAIGGTKAIVPSEGIVFKYKGKTYKFTGAFAPVNQITGLISF